LSQEDFGVGTRHLCSFIGNDRLSLGLLQFLDVLCLQALVCMGISTNITLECSPFFVSLLVACHKNSSTVITQSWCHLVEFCFFIRQPIFGLFEIRHDNLLRNFAHEKKGFQIILACHGHVCVSWILLCFQSVFCSILSMKHNGVSS
jgi:hypothetical protein